MVLDLVRYRIVKSDAEVLHRQIRRFRPTAAKIAIRAGAVRQIRRWGPGLTSAPESAMLATVSYPGGKNGSGIYQRIINLMPPHDVYVEPFLGGGAIMRLKRPADVNIGIDLSRDAIAGFRDSAGSLAGDDGAAASLELEVGCGLDFLENYACSTGRMLVYCDPPYLMSTRSGKRLYEFEMSSMEHRRLLRWAIAAKDSCSIMISGYASTLYEKALKGWNLETFDSMTRGGYPKKEHLWFNFPRPVALHDYRYLGHNFRERERIKRMKQRWAARLDRMPALQRQALLSAIADRQK